MTKENSKLTYISKYVGTSDKTKKKHKKKLFKDVRNISSCTLHDDDDEEPIEPTLDESLDDEFVGDGYPEITREIRRRRYDSDDDSVEDHETRYETKRRRRRYDSDDDSGKNRDTRYETKRRRRFDSDDDSGNSNRSRNDYVRKVVDHRHDSDDDTDSQTEQLEQDSITKQMKETEIAVNHRHDSDDDTDSQTEKDTNREKMKHKLENKYSNDRSIHDTHQQSLALNIGRVQQKNKDSMLENFKKVQNSAFARDVEDNEVDQMKKDLIREGDPMADIAFKKKNQNRIKKGKELGLDMKPMYSGPRPKPNRYNIMPGYRWDAVDRGNGFEDQVLAKAYSRIREKEKEHMNNWADM